MDAAEERGDKDPIDWVPEIVTEIPTRTERPNPAISDQWRIPRPGCGGYPERFEVVDAIAVPHDDDALRQREEIEKMTLFMVRGSLFTEPKMVGKRRKEL
ncbi:hypothetical protein G2W53_001861 [Senna tora]|uniref:Uncharacterized protein n=1 Tax=Senna tora TaxID=362788 RepID=A0A834XJF6_9FABA|nr:hypothetical protein G2W53_001861 [Senna tora]